MDTPQVRAGGPGPLADCRRCCCQVATFYDVCGGQWELRCCECGQTVKRLTTIAPLADQADAVRPVVNRHPPEHKERL